MVDIKDIEEVGESSPFGPDTEKSIIALAFDHPDMFAAVGSYITHKHFRLGETKFVMAIIERLFEKTGYVPPRHVVRDYALKHLTVDDDYEPIINTIERKSDPREIPFIKQELINWAQDAAYGLLYGEEALEAYESKNYAKLEEIFDAAKRIADVTSNGVWFFKSLDLVFERDTEEKLTCGFSKLDVFINDGGPTRGEVFCWMAPTGVGKSILLPHAGIANVKRGCKVLHVTLELSAKKTQIRYASAIADVEMHKRYEPQSRTKMLNAVEEFKKKYRGDLVIYDLPPDETNVDHISTLIHNLRRQHNWNPDVVIIDYLELMAPRRHISEEYLKQKAVATQIRGLARKENVLIFTATQTNREDGKTSGKHAGPAVIGVNRVAESYGKMMPMDYVVSANQSEEEREADTATMRLFIAKNRNGAKNKTVPIKVNYHTMKMDQLVANKITQK